jgi:hypothetical protein
LSQRDEDYIKKIENRMSQLCPFIKESPMKGTIKFAKFVKDQGLDATHRNKLLYLNKVLEIFYDCAMQVSEDHLEKQLAEVHSESLDLQVSSSILFIFLIHFSSGPSIH